MAFGVLASHRASLTCHLRRVSRAGGSEICARFTRSVRACVVWISRGAATSYEKKNALRDEDDGLACVRRELVEL